jgi:hypothetical protein
MNRALNIQHPTSNAERRTGPCARSHSMFGVRRPTFDVLVLGMLLCLSTAHAQTNTNAAARLEYSNFRVIADRNIFNPNRTSRTRSSQRDDRQPRADTFALVGTIIYEKGTFAFFDGNGSDYKQVLEPEGKIAGYVVKEILPHSVKLESAGKVVEMKVGAQMRKEDGQWRLLAQPEWTPAATPATTAANREAAADPEIEQNDILKKLMQQKEQELK